MFTPPSKESPVWALNRKLDEIRSRYAPALNAIYKEWRAALKPSEQARDAEIKAIEEEANRRRRDVYAAYDVAMKPINDEFEARFGPLKAAMDAETAAARKESARSTTRSASRALLPATNGTGTASVHRAGFPPRKKSPNGTRPSSGRWT